MDDARREVWQYARQMWESGLVAGSAGNVSRRVDERTVAVTPSQVPYAHLEAEQIVLVDADTGEVREGSLPPSYELPMHLSIYRSRADVDAIVHTHSPYVTSLSVLRMPLPPVIDEMVVMFGGAIDVAEYAFTGTQQLGTNVVRALADRNAVMLANHGNVCVGQSLERAFHLAISMEACARIYLQALAIGQPAALPETAVVAGKHLFAERAHAESRKRT